MNQSLLISSGDNNSLSMQLSDEARNSECNNSCTFNHPDCSDVRPKEEEDSVASILKSLELRVGLGQLSAQEVSCLRQKEGKYRNLYQKLLRQNSLLKSKHQRPGLSTSHHMNSSVRYGNSKSIDEQNKRRRVSLARNCQLAESVIYPATLLLANQDGHGDSVFSVLKQTKTLLLYDQSSKLKGFMSDFKTELKALDKFLNEVTSDRQKMILTLNAFSDRFLFKLNSLQDNYFEYISRVEDLVCEVRRTQDAFQVYQQHSRRLLSYYQKMHSNTSVKRQQTSTRKSQYCSEFDTTSGFKFPIAKTIENVSLFSMGLESQVDKVVAEELDNIKLVASYDLQSFPEVATRRLQEYIKYMYQLKTSVVKGECLSTTSQDPTVSHWMQVVADQLNRHINCRNLVQKLWRKEEVSSLREAFTENINQTQRQISNKRAKFIQKIKQYPNQPHHLNLFVQSSYSTFSKILLTNVMNVNEFSGKSIERTQWRKAAMASIHSMRKLMNGMALEIEGASGMTRTIIEEQQQFLTKTLKHMEYWHGTVDGLRSCLS